MKLIGRFSPVFRAMSALALIVLVGLSAEVRADDVGVEASIKLWLEGDDENSLPALSDLASSGDKTARLLLARIATQDLGPSPFRKSLSGSQARALFRDTTKGARFGRTWLAIEAAGGDPLAQALLQ